ncbi:MAG: DEAD/DEAH box helicase [Nostoc sp. ChiSLP02]|nr:DEAD/DEAH box helicase [Nostoc sp. DedSLP05]MDZ8100546.1 DEAD/DEAH box helicase [Nostoc sp. DedSLP01]MDZ8186440.1 DEAD/DEAH box helicase [Nostoc sp. ChiSLP02]
MERLLEFNTLKEIFRGDQAVGSLQAYADRVRMLHHRFLESQLASEEVRWLETDELLKFANDAEFLATEYTNPLVIQESEGLPVEDIPSRQIVQDALSLAGNIFEFLADTIDLYEKQNLELELCQSLGGTYLLKLKSALCYGLGLYEARTHVILNRLVENLDLPSLFNLQNIERWATYLFLSFLSRNLRQVLRIGQHLQEQINSIRDLLQQSLISQNSYSQDFYYLSHQEIIDIATSLSLIEAAIQASQALLRGNSELIAQARQSFDNAIQYVSQLGNYERFWIIRTAKEILERIWINSPWVRLENVINRRTYLRKLVEDGIVTLWNSQIAALEMRSTLGILNGGYLDDRVKRVIINMPTSAGKTLLAELAIAHQVFSSIDSKCVYVAPSRALCDQVAADLSSRLARFRIRVTTMVSDNDITGYESIIFGRNNVIIVTPEKLGYLIRQENTFIFSSKLFIFDELHNIGKPERGWCYEELISLLLQNIQTKNSKMIFLSAVMPNHLTVQEWVDPEKINDTISEIWQPTRLLKGVVVFDTKPPNSQVELPGHLIYVRRKEDLNSPFKINNFIQSTQILERKPGNKDQRIRWHRDRSQSHGKVHHAVSAAIKFARLGSVLVYCPQKLDASHFCEIIQTRNLPWVNIHLSHLQEVIEFVRDGLSNGHPLVKALESQVAFHHAGLPREVRNEIEYAFRKGWIRILAATSTLVEGVNLPVKTLILSDYCIRYWDGKKEVKNGILTGQEFKNIAGRAGRAAYETEGQVVFIQAIDGYPYRIFDNNFEEYLNLESNSSSLNIVSTFANEFILSELSRLVDELDNNQLTEQQLIFEIESALEARDNLKLINKLQTFTLLIQKQDMVTDDEESFVRIFQGTFLGKIIPNIAPQILGRFSHRTGRAIKNQISQVNRDLFAQTGLKISTCRTLMAKVDDYWQTKIPNINNFLYNTFNHDNLYEIAEIIYNLEDEEISAQKDLKATPSARKKRGLDDDSAFFSEWIIGSERNPSLIPDHIRDRHFSFIKEESWRAQQFVDYTQNTLGYRAPWALSAFWFFSKAVINNHGIDLANTPLGKELVLLPAYAKFGVNTPAAALFSTLGVNPSQLARQLGDLYQQQHSDTARYDYSRMLSWLLRIEPLDLEVAEIRLSYIRRLTRLLQNLRPLEESIHESERVWEVNFSIAGWQYYQGEEVLQSLRRGEIVILKPEPNNRYDPNAIEIFVERNQVEIKLGYVPRGLAYDINSRIEVGQVRATISRILPSDSSFQKVHIYCVDRSTI